MSSIYYSFDQQREQDASFTIKAMGIQLGINIGTAILVLVGFSLLRPVSFYNVILLENNVLNSFVEKLTRLRTQIKIFRTRVMKLNQNLFGL